MVQLFLVVQMRKEMSRVSLFMKQMELLTYIYRNPHVDEATAQSIVEKTLILCPELGNKKDLDIIGHCVGLRPSRTDGPRLDHQVESKRIKKKVEIA